MTVLRSFQTGGILTATLALTACASGSSVDGTTGAQATDPDTRAVLARLEVQEQRLAAQAAELERQRQELENQRRALSDIILAAQTGVALQCHRAPPNGLRPPIRPHR